MIRFAAKHVAIGAGGLITCFSFGFALAEAFGNMGRRFTDCPTPDPIELHPNVTITDWKAATP